MELVGTSTYPPLSYNAGVAQLAVQLTCNQQVVSSNLIASSMGPWCNGSIPVSKIVDSRSNRGGPANIVIV